MWIALGVRTGALTQGLAQATRAIGAFAASSRLQLARVNAAVAVLQSAKGLSALVAGIVGLGGAFLLSLGPAIRFEAAFATVAKTVNASEPQLEAIRTGILNMSREMPLAATEIAKVASTAGQLGVAQEDILVFTETMVKLGTATNLTADQAAVSMARFANIMDVPLTEVPRLGAALVELGNNMATTESEILQMSLRLAAAGAVLNISETDVLAFAAALSSLGIRAELGGSTLSRVFIEIAEAAANGGEKLETFARVAGLSSEAFARMVRSDPTEAILRFAKGLGELEGGAEAVVQVLRDTDLNSIRLRQTLLGLASGTDQLVRALGLVSAEILFATALEEEYGRQAATTAARIEILKNNVTALAIAFATPALGAVVSILDGITSAIQGLSTALAPLGTQVAAFVGNLISGFGDIGGAVLDAVGLIGTLVTTVGGLFGAFEGGGSFGAGSVFTAMIDTVTGLVAALNDLPPALLAVGVAFGGLAKVVGLTQLGVWALQVQAAVTSMAGFRSALSTAGTAAGVFLYNITPVHAAIALVAAAALLGSRELGNLRREAEGWAEASNLVAARGIAVNSLEQFERAARNARTRLEEMREAANPSWINRFGEAARDSWKIWESFTDITGTEDALYKQREQLDAFSEGVQNLITESERIPELADHFNTTSDVIFEAAAMAGLLGGQLGELPLEEVKIGLAPVIKNIESLAAVARMTREEFVDQGPSITSWAQGFLTSSEVVVAAMEIAGLSVEQMNSRAEEDLEAVGAALMGLVPVWQDYAEAAGVAEEVIAGQELNVFRLTQAYGQLEESIRGITTAQEASASPVERLNQAQANLADTVARFRSGDASLSELARAYGAVNQAVHSSGVEAGVAAAAQRELINAFVETAVDMEYTREEATLLAAVWIALTEADAAKLELEGQEVLEEAQLRIESIKDALHDPIVAIIAANNDMAIEEVEEALARGEEWALEEFEAALLANTDLLHSQVDDAVLAVLAFALMEADATLTADEAQVLASTMIAQAVVDAYRNGSPYKAILDAQADNAYAVADAATLGLLEYATGDYEAHLTAEAESAKAEVATTKALLDVFKMGPYKATMEATATQAYAEADAATMRLNDFKDGDYEATLDADPAPAEFAGQKARGTLEAVVGRTYRATISADPGPARAGAAAAQAAINSVRSVTRYVYVRTVNIGGNADGGVHYYARGGMEQHIAQISRGTNPIRVWSEPETGGEAYIPLHPNKRLRSMSILEQVARIFNRKLMPMATGGLLTPEFINRGFSGVYAGGPQVVVGPGAFQFTVNADRMNPAEVEAMTSRVVDRAIGDFARGLSRNARGSRTIR